jgi:hypothetical protein
MDTTLLYGHHYNGMTNNYEYTESGEKLLDVYEGIYQYTSSNGNKVYPVLKHRGCVNITTRQFFKARKLPSKIIREEGNRVFLNRYGDPAYTPLPLLFVELGYPDTLLNEITNAVVAASDNPAIRSYDRTRVGGENDGIVNF